MIKCSCPLFLSCKNYKPLLTSLQNSLKLKANMNSIIVTIHSKGILNSKQPTYRLYNTFMLQYKLQQHLMACDVLLIGASTAIPKIVGDIL